MGIGFGDVVGLLALDNAEWVTSFFGTLKVGAISLGMNTLLTPREFAHILEDSRARVLIVHETLLEGIEETRDEAQFLEHVIVIGTNVAETLSWENGCSPATNTTWMTRATSGTQAGRTTC